jgi:hypothetical protein
MRRALNFVRTGVSGWTMMKTSEEEAEAAKARGGVCGRCHHRVELSIGAVPDCVLVQGELRHLSCFLSECSATPALPARIPSILQTLTVGDDSELGSRDEGPQL